MRSHIRNIFPFLIYLLSIFVCGFAIAEESNAAVNSEPTAKLFATVNGDSITLSEYAEALNIGFKKTFYHGRPPEGELDEFQLEVGQRLLDEQLLLQEAQRRNIKPDMAWIEKRIDARTEQARTHPKWSEREEQIVARLSDEYRRESLLKLVKEELKKVPTPTQSELNQYYRDNQDKFTTPVRDRISIILLKVQPWDPEEIWAQAKLEVERIAFQLAEGADFAEMAETFSQHTSADQGGDMGFLHRGMLGEDEQKIVDALKPGDISEATRVLEGVAIIKLTEREESQLNPFDQVAERASGLWVEENQQSQYRKNLDDLREKAEIKVVAKQFLDLPGATVRGWVPVSN